MPRLHTRHHHHGPRLDGDAVPDWRGRALCARPDSDPIDWFPEGKGYWARQAVEQAKWRCLFECPVHQACRATAETMDPPITSGIWGGKDFDIDRAGRAAS